MLLIFPINHKVYASTVEVLLTWYTVYREDLVRTVQYLFTQARYAVRYKILCHHLVFYVIWELSTIFEGSFLVK